MKEYYQWRAHTRHIYIKMDTATYAMLFPDGELVTVLFSIDNPDVIPLTIDHLYYLVYNNCYNKNVIKQVIMDVLKYEDQ